MDETEAPQPRRKRGRPPKKAANGKANGHSLVASSKPPRPRKRPVNALYTEEIATVICDRLANGETLRHICRTPGMPNEATVRLWARDPDHPFAPHYDRAREIGYQCMADELLDLADGTSNGSKAVATKEDAAAANAQVQRDRLKVDTRKWLMARALPKVFGDRIDVNTKVGLVVVKLSDEDMAL